MESFRYPKYVSFAFLIVTSHLFHHYVILFSLPIESIVKLNNGIFRNLKLYNYDT